MTPVITPNLNLCDECPFWAKDVTALGTATKAEVADSGQPNFRSLPNDRLNPAANAKPAMSNGKLPIAT